MKPLVSEFEKFKFSDNYTYPVIDIDNPDILKKFYNHSKLVLIDFADYKEQFLWARLIVKCSLWFAFAYHIIKLFRVRFTIS